MRGADGESITVAMSKSSRAEGKPWKQQARKMTPTLRTRKDSIETAHVILATSNRATQDELKPPALILLAVTMPKCGETATRYLLHANGSYWPVEVLARETVIVRGNRFPHPTDTCRHRQALPESVGGLAVKIQQLKHNHRDERTWQAP